MAVLFPKWMNVFPTVFAIGGLSAFCSVVGGFWYYATPKFFDVGYSPIQPGDPGSDAGFPHQLHAGKLGMDCRYCHTKVEQSAEANIPNVATCYGCHGENKLRAWQSHRVKFVREAYAKDESIEYRRVHKLPDYVRNFPHHLHINAGPDSGVSCYSCHGNIHEMPIVHQVQPLGMGWCLDCHRNPEPNLVPKEMVTKLSDARTFLSDPASRNKLAAAYGIESQKLPAALALEALHIAPPENCGACHY